MKNKILTLLMAVAVVLAVGCATAGPIAGTVDDKAIDPPRSVRYPGAGITQDINQKPVYWTQLNGKWHRVTQDEHGQAVIGSTWARFEVAQFTPPF